MLELFHAKWKWRSKTSSLSHYIRFAIDSTGYHPGPSNVVNQPNTPIHLFPEMVGMSHPELEVYVFSFATDDIPSKLVKDVNVTSAAW